MTYAPPLPSMEPWPHQPELCAADDQFIAWVRTRMPWRAGTVLHFGTGDHHRVGRILCTERRLMQVLGATGSIEELNTWARLREAGEVPRKYAVVFGDQYCWPWELMPEMDLVTLFHLGEFDWRNARDTLNEVIVSAADQSPTGLIAFYTGSAGWPQTKHAIEVATAGGILQLYERYEQLEFYHARQ